MRNFCPFAPNTNFNFHRVSCCCASLTYSKIALSSVIGLIELYIVITFFYFLCAKYSKYAEPNETIQNLQSKF